MTSSGDIFYLAPLRGVTGRTFRNLLCEWFDAPDVAVAPFIPTFAGVKVKPALLADVDPALGQMLAVIPQAIGKDPAQLRVLLRSFKEMGYRRADLNAGCPWPFVCKKGRGSGLMADADAFEMMLAAGCEEMPEGFSVKVRLGLKTPDLLAKRMEIINRYPLREVTIHARTAKQMYEGTVDLERFAEAAALCKHPVVYNGDIKTAADWLRLKARFPQITRWMIGRGLAMNPSLIASLNAGQDLPIDTARLRQFLAAYLAATEKELSGPASILGRMKELWSYIRFSFRNGESLWRSVRLCRTLEEYKSVIG
jgi:tRNA-dihydrouridine synthase B